MNEDTYNGVDHPRAKCCESCPYPEPGCGPILTLDEEPMGAGEGGDGGAVAKA